MRRFWQYFKKQQLFQFAVVAGFIFLLFELTTSSKKPEIIVTKAIIDDLVDLRSQVIGYELNEKEKAELINNYIDEEILLKEAYDQGLDRNDTKLRERLIAKMRFLLSKEAVEPSEDTLRAFYDEQISLYMMPEYISFDQVFFKEENSETIKESFLEELASADDPFSFGEPLALGNQLKQNAKADLKMMFGEAFANKLFALQIDIWHGPMESDLGIHYIRVFEKIDAIPYPFKRVREFVREDWSVFQSQSSLSKQIEKLQKGYSIKIEQ